MEITPKLTDTSLGEQHKTEYHVKIWSIKVTTLSPSGDVVNIDCSKCDAPCCKGIGTPLLTEEEFLSGKYPIRVVDIPELKKELPNTENVIGLAMSKNGCFFLKNNRCSIYNERPQACRIYNCKTDDRKDVVEFVKKRFRNGRNGG